MTNNNKKLEALETRITKLENFISERLDKVIDGKIQLIESYFIKKIDELNNRIDSEIDDVRGDIPDDCDSETNNLEHEVNSLDRRVDDIERRLSDLE